MKSLPARRIILSAAAFALFASQEFGATTALALPKVSLSPTTGHPKITMQVSGSGFGVGKAVDIYWDMTDQLLVISDGSGKIPKTPLQVPAEASPGQHWVTAVERDNGNGAQKAFTVRTDWSEFGFSLLGQHRNPYENVISKSNVSTLDVFWASPAKGVYSSPAISGGVAYVGGGNGGVYAFNVATGAQKWSSSACSDVYGSSPTVANGVVYVGCWGDGQLYALDASDGSTKWSMATGQSIQSSPAVANGLVYIGSTNGTLYAVDATSGAQKWTATTAGQIRSSPAIANGIVYIGSSDFKLYAFDAISGTKLWNYTTGNYITGSPLVAGGTVYIGSQDGKLYALSAASGAFHWAFQAPAAIVVTPAYSNGIVYVGVTDGKIYAVKNGILVWSSSVGASNLYDAVSVANGILYADTSDCCVHALDASSGTELWSANVGNDANSPVIADGVLYVGSGTQDQNLYAFALDGGNNAVYRRNPAQSPFASLHPNYRLRPSR